MDFYFTRLPLFGGLILRAPSSVLRGFPVRRPKLLVGLEFPAFVVVSMLLLAVGAFRKRLTGLFGFSFDWGLQGGKMFFEHCYHVFHLLFHLLRVFFVHCICHLGDHHGLCFNA